MTMYDPVMVQPMRDELVRGGVKELTTADEVNEVLGGTDTSVVLINSVCGCAAGTARPGYLSSLQNDIVPKNVTTVFAGVDKEAVQQARAKIVGYAPSSPSIAVFRDGRVVDFIERHHIESFSGPQLAARLKQSYDKYCGAEVNEEVEIKDPMAEMEATPAEIKAMMDSGASFKLLDVRTPEEANLAKIEGAQLLTEELVGEIIQSWDKEETLVLYCHHGIRSIQAARYFAMNGGFKTVKSMTGGIEAWAKTVDSSVGTY